MIGENHSEEKCFLCVQTPARLANVTGSGSAMRKGADGCISRGPLKLYIT